MIIKFLNEVKKCGSELYNNSVGYLFGRVFSQLKITLPVLGGMAAIAALVIYVYGRNKKNKSDRNSSIKASPTNCTNIPQTNVEDQRKNTKISAIKPEQTTQNSQNSAQSTTKINKVALKNLPDISLKETFEEIPLKETFSHIEEKFKKPEKEDIKITSHLATDFQTKATNNENLQKKIIETPPPTDLPPFLPQENTSNLTNEIPIPTYLPPAFIEENLQDNNKEMIEERIPFSTDLQEEFSIENNSNVPSETPPPSDLPPKLPNNKISIFKTLSQSSISKTFSKNKSKKEVKDLPNDLESTIENNVKVLRSDTLIKAMQAHAKCKKLYKIFSEENKKSRLETISQGATTLLNKIKIKISTKDNQNDSAIINDYILQIKTEGLDKLKELKNHLKEDEVVTQEEELLNKSRLNGILKTIEFKIEDLMKANYINKSFTGSIVKKINLLIEDLKTEKKAIPEKIIESTVDSWDDEMEQRNNFFNELFSAEYRLSFDLTLFFNGPNGIQAKLQENQDFCIKYQTICENSHKMVKEFKKLDTENSDAEKMAKVVKIFKSNDFKEYVSSIKEYFPLAKYDFLLKSGIDNRALTLAITRLALYPLLMEQAIKLTPPSAQEYEDLLLELKILKDQLQFLAT